MTYKELISKSEEGTLVLAKLSYNIIQNLGFDLGYDADFDLRGWDIDSWMENTFDFSLSEDEYYDLYMLDSYIDGFSADAYFGDKEVVSYTVGHSTYDYDEIALLVKLS